MNLTKFEVRRGAYYDSVVLMQLQKGLAGLPGVQDAGVVMATPANRELLEASGFVLTGIAAKPDDLLIVVKGENETAVSHALAQIDPLLQKQRPVGGQDFRPKSLESAVKQQPDTAWVLVSVPGRYAAGVARDALNLGKHVFLYSDNVPLADEIALKQAARAKGLLVMGPDCGTAIINGVGLGFANTVRRGHIGLVGASGTGLQAVTSEIHNLGGGISQAIGTGGRDLKAEVGAITAHQALRFLAQDPQTQVIALISKPPSPAVAADLLLAANATGKPVVVDFIGYPPPGRQIGNLYFATSLSETAELAIQLFNLQSPISNLHSPLPGYVRGLFSGGTIAYEVLLGLQAVLTPIYSNAPFRPEQKLANVHTSQGHTLLDLGEDEFTQGRLHPMMDNDLRLRRLRQETADPEVGFILLDVVLGEGAHPDPAGDLAPAIAEAKKQGKEVVTIVIGTEHDPQDLNSQIERLMAAGATVFATANEAVDYVFNRLPYTPPDHPAIQIPDGMVAINVGVESFWQSVVGQGGTAVQVEWRPPAGGNEKLAGILAKMKKAG